MTDLLSPIVDETVAWLAQELRAEFDRSRYEHDGYPLSLRLSLCWGEVLNRAAYRVASHADIGALDTETGRQALSIFRAARRRRSHASLRSAMMRLRR